MRLTLTSAAVAALAVSCASTPPKAAEAPPPAAQLAGEGAPLDFVFEAADLQAPPVDARSLRGAPAVVALLTTYDLASQAQARFLASAIERERGRVRAVIVLLEPGENRLLGAAFRATLGLQMPIGMADERTIAGRGPFGALHSVPSLLVLDRAGRVAWTATTLTKDDALGEVLARVR